MPSPSPPESPGNSKSQLSVGMADRSVEDSPAGAADSPASGQERNQRSGTVLVILLIAANFLFLLLTAPLHGLAALDQDISAFNGEEADSGWFPVWPGMLIVWGAAWVGFLVFALKSHVRSALITFNLIAAVWLLPMALYLLSLIAGA